MIPLFLALVAVAPVASTLNQKAACRLAAAHRIPSSKIYSLRGTYFGAAHGATLELPKCSGTIVPALVGNAAVAVNAWHDAYRDKCGVWLHGDFIRGRFTGTFSRRNLRIPMINKFAMVNLFIVTDVTSKDLDISAINCDQHALGEPLSVSELPVGQRQPPTNRGHFEAFLPTITA